MLTVNKARASWNNRSQQGKHGSVIPKIYRPPYSGTAFYGQPFRAEMTWHFRHYVFVAIAAWMREVAGGEGPKLGRLIRNSNPSAKSAPQRITRVVPSSPITKAAAGPRSHEEFDPWQHDHPLVRLFNSPNGLDVPYDLWAFTTMFLKLTAEAHWWVIRDAFGIPVEVWVIPTHWKRGPYTNGEGQPSYYTIQAPWGIICNIPMDEVVSFYEHSPLNRWEGFGVTQAMAEAIDSFEQLTRSRLAVWLNNGTPSTHIQLGEGYGDPDDALLQRFYAKWQQRFGGSDQAGRPIITGPDITIKGVEGHRPADMLAASNESEILLRDEILAAFSVPKAIVGLVTEMTYGCLDTEAECLTATGWKKYNELDTNTRVACYDPETKKIVYNQPDKIIVKPYKGVMHKWVNQSTDILLSPSHRTWIQEISGSSLEESYKVLLVKDIPEKLDFNVLLTAPVASITPTEGFNGVWSEKEKIPEAIKAWSAENLRPLLATLTWDNGKYISTTSQQFADDVQEIAVKCGLTSTLSKTGDTYTVGISSNTYAWVQSNDRTEVEYDGLIWCVSVPTGLFVVRRNGKVQITGNSVEASIDSFREYAVNNCLTYLISQVITQKIIRPTPGWEDGLCYWEDRATGNSEFRLNKQSQDVNLGVRSINEIRTEDGLPAYEKGGNNPRFNGEELPYVEDLPEQPINPEGLEQEEFTPPPNPAEGLAQRPDGTMVSEQAPKSLKSRINKRRVVRKSNAQSWLDTSGHFHQTWGTGSHAGWAEANGYTQDELFKEGWMRVVWIGDTLYLQNGMGVRPNSNQESAIVDYALTSGRFKEVAFDNDLSDRVIWSKEDKSAKMRVSKVQKLPENITLEPAVMGSRHGVDAYDSTTGEKIGWMNWDADRVRAG